MTPDFARGVMVGMLITIAALVLGVVASERSRE